ncbi:MULTISPECIES: hypothetical protein [Pseudomonas]|uniref:Uncharacterized protein n=1 Tax=Pseudomonas protegens TaxID=380021 RepID=A0A2T6GFT4_9PSED|nr:MULTISPECIES: hypothetical protein [Pseudomonas]PUA43020.1 hypothetical protein C5U62_20405 [Pseudomonas protegens]RXU58554.1 hypothetical protein CW358_30730 [Pseudomonas protegens]ULT73492.1 hypothetical protein L1O02_14295 [Pseudomonas sp. BC42]BAQ75002.1 uncharacterized protein POS17_3308 [Pseudomonas sp. Os17]BAQ81300.1 uncharacterized protein PST29_3411 [Pseudomonas sp. St29]
MKRLSCYTAALLLLSALPWTLHAEDASEGCVEVSVGGYKAPDYNCLSKQMGNNPDAVKAAQANQQAMDKPVNKRPPNQVGLSTPAATSVRMGNTFGTSVKPQRP